MPHYADGTPALPGDLVVGKLPDATSPLVGEVICVGGETPCTLHVAVAGVQSVGPNQDLPQHGLHFGPQGEAFGVTSDVAQAPAGYFELLWRREAPPVFVLPQARLQGLLDEAAEKTEARLKAEAKGKAGKSKKADDTQADSDKAS